MGSKGGYRSHEVKTQIFYLISVVNGEQQKNILDYLNRVLKLNCLSLMDKNKKKILYKFKGNAKNYTRPGLMGYMQNKWGITPKY